MSKEKVYKLSKTKNYKMFAVHECNRNLHKHKLLEKSMRMFGFDPGFPIRCIKEDGRLRITSGHNRFHFAQKLGLDVYYIVSENTGLDIFYAESGNKAWTLNDYTIARARGGQADCKAALGFSKEHGLPLMMTLSVCAGETGTSGNMSEKVRAGNYKIKDMNYANEIAEIVGKLKNMGISYANTSNFAKAISRCLRFDGFDVERFLFKANAYTSIFKKCRTTDDYMQLIDDVYNFGTQIRNRVALVFEVNKACAGRSACLEG